MPKNNPYFFLSGIKQLAQEMRGDENIYLGIRPYGYHAGNQLSLYMYPLLLSQELEKLGKEVKLNLYIFLNDWEQDSLLGPDLQLYPFNVWPKTTTFQYLPDPEGCCESMADHWCPIIVEGISKITAKYPKITIYPVRNSDMKDAPVMKKVVIDTIQNPEKIYKILKKHSMRDILPKPIMYSIAICPECKTTNGNTSYIDKKIMHICNTCKKVFSEEYSFFDYWLYHKPLALPRIKLFKIDLCITGADHYNEGDYDVRKKLFEAFNIPLHTYPKTLYAPSLYARDGRQMGKSKGNAQLLSDDALYTLALKTDTNIAQL